MKRGLVLLLVWSTLVALALAQETRCYLCHSDRQLTPVRYRDGEHMICQKCMTTQPRCDICGNPTNQKRHRDGRIICAGCLATGVFTQADMDKVYQEVQGFIKSTLGGIEIKPWPPVQVVDKDELQTKFTRSGRSLDVAGFYQPYNPEMIYILSGDSKIETGAVLVHEYTHAWQSRNCPPQDRALTEGFASWVGYKYLMSKGETKKAQALTRHQDPDYGASLVKLLAMETKLGSPKALIDWAHKAPRLP